MTDAPVLLGVLADVPDRISLMARADPEIMELVHAALSQLWVAHPDITEGDRIRFETAVMEVLGNIIEHAYRLDSGSDSPDAHARRFHLVLGVTHDQVVATFGDNGEPAELDLSAASMPGMEAESGRGLPLAKAALDELHFERIDGRNHWTLVRRRQVG